MKNQIDFENILQMTDKISLFGHELTIVNSKTVQEVQTTRKIQNNVKLFISENSRDGNQTPSPTHSDN